MLRHCCIQNVVAKASAALRESPAEPIQPGYVVPAGTAGDTEVGYGGRLELPARARHAAW